jgi:hypothetical protein
MPVDHEKISRDVERQCCAVRDVLWQLSIDEKMLADLTAELGFGEEFAALSNEERAQLRRDFEKLSDNMNRTVMRADASIRRLLDPQWRKALA